MKRLEGIRDKVLVKQTVNDSEESAKLRNLWEKKSKIFFSSKGTHIDKVWELISSKQLSSLWLDWVGGEVRGYQMKAASMKEKQNNVIVSGSLRNCFQVGDKGKREQAR